MREEHRRLAGRVTSSDHEYPLAHNTMGLLTRGAVEYPPAKQAVQSRNFDPMPLDPSRQQHSEGKNVLATIQVKAITRICLLYRFDAACYGDLRAEVSCLLECALGKFNAGDAGGKTQVVFNPGGGTCLSPGGRAFHNQHLQPFRGSIDSSRHACRPGAGDDNVITLGLRRGLETQHLCDVADRRSCQWRRTIDDDCDSIVR